MRLFRRLPGALVLALLFLLVSSRGASGLREDDLQCEQAASHLEECCPGFDVTKLSCAFSSGCGDTRYTAFSIAESECIQDTDCKTLIANGVCARAQGRTEVFADAAPPASVCP